MRLLIVEDHGPMRRLIKSMLRDLAAEVRECADGAEALAAYAEFGPDWVLMDIKMAGLDGIAATRQILAADPRARIVIVTDYDDAHLREAARSAGACQYLLKEDLLDIRRILGADQAP